MSINISGMDMMTLAEDEYFAVVIYADGTIRSIFGNVIEGATATPIPPHGDLVDREALMDDIICSTVLSGRKAPKEATIVQEVLDIVGDANAIIPAEEATE